MNRSAISGRQYAVRPDESDGLSGMRARSSPFPRLPEEAHSTQRTAEMLRTEALPLLKAQSVRFSFDRPAVPSNGRALSFFRAGVTPMIEMVGGSSFIMKLLFFSKQFKYDRFEQIRTLRPNVTIP